MKDTRDWYKCKDGRNRSNKNCCCGGHNASNPKKNKHHHSTMVRLFRRQLKRFKNYFINQVK